MKLTIKQIIDQVLSEVNHPIENVYFTGNNNVITAIANRSANYLAQGFHSELKKNNDIRMEDGTLKYALPTDFRYLVPDSMQAVDDNRAVIMPTDDTQWHYLKAQSSNSSIVYKCRIFDGAFNFESIENGQYINYEYISKYVIATSNTNKTNTRNLTGVKERFTTDNDYFLLDDDLLMLDMLWRYGKTKSIEGWQADKQIFDDYYKQYKGNSDGSMTLDFTGEDNDGLSKPHYNLWQ